MYSRYQTRYFIIDRLGDVLKESQSILERNNRIRIGTRLAIMIFLFVSLILSMTACTKLVEVESPVTSINETNVYASDATAISVLTGLYAKMSRNGISGERGISLLSGLSADELVLYSGVSSTSHVAYYKNALLGGSVSNNVGSDFWSTFYNYIFTCNAAIEGLLSSNTLTPSVKQQLLGEAKFMRAFFYFYLVNLFGDVPLVTTTDPAINAAMARTPRTQIYQQIITDLKEAQNLLSADYLNGNLQVYSSASERVRPTKWSASALLARVYLYNGNLTNDASSYVNAEAQSTLVINNSAHFTLSTLSNAFLKASMGNNEAIWQLQPVTTGRNTEDGWIFILPSSGPSNNTTNPVYLSIQQLNSFEAGDNRKTDWVRSVTVGATTYYYPYKYKSATLNAPVTEYLMVLRLAEQYLIRAETRAKQNNIAGAQSDLNAIRTRAGLPNTTASTQPALLAAIAHERQLELFSEWGHRWFDLKRTGTVDAVMTLVTPLKGGGAWQSYQQFYPILVSDIQKNTNLVQNAGY